MYSRGEGEGNITKEGNRGEHRGGEQRREKKKKCGVRKRDKKKKKQREATTKGKRHRNSEASTRAFCSIAWHQLAHYCVLLHTHMRIEY